ncbi:MAG: hypothetical protein AUG00_00825 [Candidatus Rokubacteria bacterium 13_1_20CM_2_70_7]|nr:MAG: hypothetical protein AUG00_00825 [Candidatus Rokubacteria bacterium 13_1_20CM_2_70_7]
MMTRAMVISQTLPSLQNGFSRSISRLRFRIRVSSPLDRYWAGEPRFLDDSNNRTTGQHRPAT